MFAPEESVSPTVHRTVGLSSFQKELWLAHEALPAGHPGISSGVRTLVEGEIIASTAREALRHLIAHFPLLSATLCPGPGGLPVFRTGEHPEPQIIFSDVSGAEDPERAALDACEAFAESPFTPLGGPLVRFALIRFSGTKAFFLQQNLHLVCSGLSNIAYFSLFAQIYAAVLEGRPVDLGPAPDWQQTVDSDQAYAASARAAKDRLFWQEETRRAPEERVFPPLPGHPDRLGDSAFCTRPLSSAAMRHLNLAASSTGVNIPALLTTAHAVALGALLDATVPVVFTVDNGERKNMLRMQGFMVNAVPVIPELKPEMTFTQAAQSVAVQIQRLRRHARTSVPAALRASHGLRGLAHLWDTNLNYIGELPVGNAYFQLRDYIPICLREDEIVLGLYVVRGIEDGAPLRIVVQYSRNHFSEEGVRRYMARFEAALAMAEADPLPLGAYSPLLADERAALERWESGGEKPVPAVSIPQLFDGVARRHADRPAVCGEDGSRRSYARVCRHAGALAQRLGASGIGKGDMVAVLARRHPGLPECILGIMACGAVYLPLDPDYPAERVSHMLEDSGARIVVALEAEDARGLIEAGRDCLIWDAGADERADAFSGNWMPAAPSPADPAYLIYTSGSTGTPKGVLVPHGGFVNMILAQIEAFGITATDHVLQFASPSFDASLSEIFMALMTGAASCPVSRARIDAPWRLRDYMAENAVSVATFPPSYLALFKGENFPGLRVLLTAGEAPVAEDARRYAAELAYFNAYGPTEASVCAALQRILPEAASCAEIGRPLPNTRAHILDSRGRRVAPGMVGELWLSGAGLALGYHGRPELTAERFVEPADLPGFRCYRTGDRAMWTTDGRLRLLGRTDDQVKIRGQRVETGEVAAALEDCPLVAQAVVVAVPNGSSHRLAAFILPRGGPRDCDAESLADWLRRRLPVYMLPGSYHLVEAFPLTPAGKVDKRALIGRAEAEPAAPSVRPRLSAREARVAGVYAAVLGRAVEDPEEDFFLMGGDSLKAAELLHRLEKECGIRLAMRDFLAASSPRSVVGCAERPATDGGAAAPLADGAPISCNAGQVALWAQECSHAPSARYHMPLVAELRGGEGAVLPFVEAVREALAAQPLCAGRLGGPVEAPEFLPFSLPVPQCRRYEAGDQAALRDRLDAVIHAPFALRSQPPVRLALLRTAEESWLFALVMHHLAGDAIGLRAIMDDAARLLAGDALPDIPRAALLRGAVAEERRFLASPLRDGEAAFWRRMLSPLPPTVSGSLGLTRTKGPTVLSGQGGQLTAELPPATVEGLRRLARQGGTTLLGAMLGLLGVFLCRRAGREACVVAVPVGTREGASLSRVCGYFVNPVPVRLVAPPDAAEAARRAGGTLRAAAAHSRLPARMIAEAVPVEQRAVLTEIFATHMDLGLPPLPEGCGLEIEPRLPLLRAAKGAFSFILLTGGPATRLVEQCALVLEYDWAVLDQDGARTLLADWARFVAGAVGDPDAVVTVVAPEEDAARHDAVSAERDGTPAGTSAPGANVVAALEQAWREVLGASPQASDNFFLSGGDSIKAIQLSGRLRQAGFPDFPPARCFSHPNFKELCACLAAHAASVSGPAAACAPAAPNPDEAVPLPPLHALWVARHPDDWHDFHMALPLRLRSGADVARLKSGVAALGERHEALRMRFNASALTCEAPSSPLWLEQEFAPAMPLRQCFTEAARRLFPPLSRAREAGSGPLYGAIFFRHGGTNYLLFAAHHFALDALSLEILRQELAAFSTRGVWPGDAPECGAAAWAKLLAKHDVFASTRDFEAEAAFWREMCAGFPERDGLESGPERAPRPDTLSRRTSLSRTVAGFAFDRTRRGGGLPEILAGLEAALRAVKGKPLLLTLETHGREALLPGVDISRTVGWFTAAFPLALRPLPVEAEGGSGLMPVADAWAARLDSLPLRGARRAFAVTRAPELARRADMSLNYLGVALTACGAEDPLEILPRFAAPDVLPGLLPHGFVSDCPVDVLVFGGEEDRLELVAAFAPDGTRPDTVAALLDAWKNALEVLALERRQAEAESAALTRLCLCAPESVAETGAPDPAQEAMLYQWLLDGEQGRPAAHYVQQITFALRSGADGDSSRDASDDGELNADALEAAWAELVRRHEGLRTLFPRTTAGAFRRVVLSGTRSCAERLDLASLPPLIQQERRDRHLRELRGTPFDLARGPLLFLTLFCRRDERGVFWEMSWCFPHLLMDGWCIGIMLRELLALYAARRAGRNAALPEAPSLARIRAALGPVDGVALREYWTAELAGYDKAVSIVDVLARLFPAVETEPDNAEQAAGDGVLESRLELDAGTSRVLVRTAARLSVTPSQLLQAAWALLLGGGRERDVVFGLVHSGRPAQIPGIENVIGLFIRTLPVRVRWTEATPFAALAARVRDAALARAAHERDMLADIQLCREGGGALFDHILVFENYPLDGIATDGDPRLEGVEGFERQPYPLALSVLTGETYSFRFSCDARRIPPARLAALIRCWRDLLQALARSAPAEAPTEATTDAASPTCAALEAVLPASAAAPRVPASFNATARPYERDGSIHGLFLDMARACPERPACIGMDGDIWSYAELAVAAARVAHALRGLEAGEPVALAMPRCPECVAAMLGVLMAGGCFMPLDERNPAERTRNMLDAAACRRVIYRRGAETVLPADIVSESPAGLLARLEYDALMNGPAVAVGGYAPGGAAPAYIMFTSGTTGLPKGVLVPHRGVLRLARNASFWQLLPGERVGQTGSFGFDASTLELWGTLLNGGTVCFLDEDTLLSPELLRRRIKAWKISVMWLTAGLFSTLAAEAPDIFLPLRCLYSGGDTMSVPQAARVLAACPGLELYNGYGPTENTTFTAVHRVSPEDVGEGVRSVPLGRPVSNTRVHIVTESGALAGVDEWGEICAAGDGLALGYCRNPKATERAFQVLPQAGERVYRTGDLGRWRADGLLEFGGRRDGQIKLRGFRIELEDIENAFLRLTGVKDAAVAVTGEGADKMLAAFVTGAGLASEREMRAALRAVLPEYMIPTHIFPQPDLPVNSNGKRDRRALAALAEQLLAAWKRTGRAGTTDAPLSGEGTAAAAVSSPRDLEEGVAAVFSAVLDVPAQGAEADFFQLGGQSLKAMRLLARLNGRFGVALTLSEILRLRTVGALAARIHSLRAGAGNHPLAVERADDGPGAIPAKDIDWPLSPAQEQLWFQQRLYPDSPVYSVISVFRLAGVPDPDVLQRALLLLEERHEALRLRLSGKVDARGPRQRLAPAGGLRLRVEDCRTAADPGERVAQLVAEEQDRPFRFGDDQPLARACCFVESPDSAVLMLLVHHCVCDGWSMEVLLTDLDRAYAMALEDRGRTWPDAPAGYLALVRERNERLAASAGRAALDRWVRRLSPLPEPLQLPADRPRPTVRNFEGGALVQRLPAPLTTALRRRAKENDATLFPVLLALTEVFCFRHTGQRDMVLGVPAACRGRAEEQDVVGLLMNVLPLRLDVNGEAAFDACVRRCAAVLGEALEDAECPVEHMLRELPVRRDAGRNPLFDVLVAFEEQTWAGKPAVGHFSLEPYPITGRQSRLDLSLFFRDRGDELEIHWEYSAALFKRETVERMAARFALLAEAACGSDAALPVARLPLLPPEEARLLERFNATREDWDCSGGIHACFMAQAARTPRAPALRGADGATLSYAEFARGTERLADWLTAQGVRPGSAVGVCFPRGVGLLTAIFAVIRAGGLYVPIVPDLPDGRIRAMLEDLPSDTLLLAAPEQAGLLGAPAGACGNRLLLAPKEPLAARPPSLPAPPPDALAYILFTSGSTGRPKGVMVEQRGVLNRIFWMQSRFPLGPDDVILHKTPVSFDVSVWELFWWSWYGASLALLAPGDERDPAAIVEAVERHKVTVIHFVPSMLRVFLEHCSRRSGAVARLASLKRVFASGEALTPDCVRLFNELLFESNGTELHNLYGPTEATVDVTWQPCSPFPADAARVPIGRPVSNTVISVRDDAGQTVPLGVTGELVISGVQVARGYVKRPDLTAKAFDADPAGGARRYRTGDLARWTADGVLEYLGRRDDQVKIRGFRIELGEVEAALEACPGVAQAVARVGSVGGLPALEAYLLPGRGGELSLSAIRAALSQRLPAYMCPTAFYRVESIPLGSSGKADRQALRGRRLDAQGTEMRSGSALSDPSDSALEEAVRLCWRAVLPEAGDLPPDVSFFDAGGSSLLLVRLLDRLEERWPGCFTLPELFASPDIGAQAEKLRLSGQEDGDAARGKSPSRGPAGRQGSIAIIGMALRLADYDDAGAFWSDLLSGADRVRALPEQRCREQSSMLAAAGIPLSGAGFKSAAYLDDISGFDPARLGMAPGDARIIDPEQRLFFSTALRALEDAGYGGNALNNAAVGVFVGACSASPFRQAVALSLPDQAEQAYMLNVPSAVAARLSYMHNWSGPAAVVDTACSSVPAALHQACAALRRGECSLALTGGARVQFALLQGTSAFAIESASSRTLSFDAAADGTCAGEGAAVFLLKPLEQALADRDAIHAVILGSAVNQDGRSAGIAAPNPVAQAAVIQAAATASGIVPGDLHFIEAHGTGTALGDPVEIDGLRRAFAGNPPRRSMPIGSVKGNFGHLDAAAGAVGLAKAILTLKHGLVPGQPHFSRPNPRIDFAAASVHVVERQEPLPGDGHPWRGGISSFGLSGINAHVIVQEAPLREPEAEPEGWCCVPLSASSPDGLRRYARELLAALEERPRALRDVAGTLACGREHLSFRVACAARNAHQLCEELVRWLCAGGQSHAVVPGAERAAVFCAGEAEARSAVTAFLRGAAPAWEADRTFTRLHLPPVPLERVACWPVFSSRTAHDAPWPGEAAATPQGRHCPVPLHDADFWPVAEHIVAGRSTLMGMAFPALTGNAAARLRPAAAFVLENVHWSRPLASDACAEATLSLIPQQDGFAVELRASSSRATGGEAWTTFVSARLRFAGAAESPEPLSAASLREGMEPLPLPSAPVKELVRASERWRCRKAVWRTEDGRVTLARLALPPRYAGDFARLPWHPALLDVAASLALDDRPLLPAACAAITLRRPFPQELWARCALRSCGKDASALVVDCRLYDDEGRELAALDGLSFLPLRPPQACLHRLEWTPFSVPKASPALDGPVLLLGEGPLREDLAAVLRSRGIAVEPLAYPRGEETCAALAERLRTSGVRHVLVVLPEALTGWEAAAPVRAMLRMLSGGVPGKDRRLSWLCVGRVGGGRAVPEQALALGVLLAARREEAGFAANFVDIPCDEEGHIPAPAASALADCLFYTALASPEDAERMAWLRLDAAGGFFSPGLSSPLEADVAALPQSAPEECVLITGGLGAMALTLARQLVPRLGGRAALLHRGAFPAEADWDAPADNRTAERIEALRELRRRGVDFRLYACDVTDEHSLSGVLERVRRECGPIGAVIHTAGVAGDGFLLRKDDEAFEDVVAPKLEGARLLHRLTLGDPVRHFVLASSRTALAGAAGQSDYTAANAALDSFARWRAAQGLPALSLAWNTWAETGMAARAGISAPFMLSPDQAGDALLRALASGAEHVILSMPGEPLSAAPEPSASRTSTAALPMAARDMAGRPVPEVVRVVMERVLGYEDRLTPDDDFYALGGDSLSGMRIVTAINAALGASVGLADLLSCSRIGAFCARVSELLENGASAARPASAPAMPDYPVSREQLAVLRAETVSGPHTGYNLPQFLPLPPECGLEALRGALEALTARHEILRTCFVRLEQPEPRMLVRAAVAVALPELDFSCLEEAAAELIRPFDLREPPLFRAALLRIDRLPEGTAGSSGNSGHKVLFFDIHHSLADAKGVGILLRDLRDLLAGKTPPLVSLQQKDAAWRQHEEGPEALRAARAYWLDLYADGLPRTELAADFARPAWHSNRGAVCSFTLPEDLTRELRRLAAACDATLHSLLYAAWALLLSVDAGGEDMVMAVAADSRGVGFEETAGMFACLLPVRLSVARGQSVSTLIRAAQRANTEALRHKGFPLGSLMAELKPAVDLSRTLLSEVTFSYMNYGAETDEDAPYIVANSGCKADLAIFVSDVAGGLRFGLEYYADLFAPARMEALGRRFAALAASFAANGVRGTLAELLSASGILEARTVSAGAGAALSADVAPASTPEGDAALEAVVIEAFREYFGLRTVAAGDNFFELGGHSLLAIQIVNALNKKLGTNLTARDLFTNPEPRSLAVRLARRDEIPATSVGHPAMPDIPPATPKEGLYPLSHAQQRLYVLHRMENGGTSYNMAFVFLLERPLDRERLAKALHALARRQEMLRTVIIEREGALWQRVREDVPPLCLFRDPAVPEQEACAAAVREALAPFDPAAGMLRLCVHPTAEGGQCLALGMHHLIGDGWSMQIFFGELMALYADPQAALPPLPMQYRDYAFAQRGRDWSGAAAYWRECLRDMPGHVALPADAPAGQSGQPGQRGPAGVATRMLARETLEKLRTFAAKRRMTLASCLLALFAALLFRLSRQDDILIGMGVAGRERKELEGLVGFFVNILPIRVRMPADGGLDELLEAVNNSCREALARQDYPFDLLVRQCAPNTAAPRENQMLNVMFEYQRYSDLAGINTLGPRAPAARIVDEEEWMPLAGGASPPARYDLTVYVQDEPRGCRLRAEYDSGRFTRGTVAQWLAFWERLMETSVGAEQ